MAENWKDIDGYEGLYKISDLGNVYSCVTDTLLKIQSNGKGYKQIGLVKNKKQKTFRLSVLVAKAFVPNPQNKPQVNHIDEDKSNNAAVNLEWCTPKENSNHGTRTRRVAEANMKAVICITTKTVYTSVTEAEAKTGAGHSHISACCLGKRKHAGKTLDGTKLAWEYALLA